MGWQEFQERLGQPKKSLGCWCYGTGAQETWIPCRTVATQNKSECRMLAGGEISLIYHIPYITYISHLLCLSQWLLEKMIQNQPWQSYSKLPPEFPHQTSAERSSIASKKSLATETSLYFFFAPLNVGIFQCHKPTLFDLFGDGFHTCLYMFTPLSAVILGWFLIRLTGISAAAKSWQIPAVSELSAWQNTRVVLWSAKNWGVVNLVNIKIT